ncbi:MAG TPA: YgeY family selenium metabolism-linked hydrolase [Symbiobacteriaceae bacterium]|nr:YgeY family selenium metabolism-linked hydrolase [Symbiobacteriaceae bacterium]
MSSEVREKARQYQDDCVRFLRDIIAIPSTSCNEKAVVERIAEEMRKVGLQDVHFAPNGCVLGRIGSGPVTILYDSHIDTVGVGDPAAWAFDPFEGKVENGIVYGRGASDNKMAIATMVHGARILKELGLDGNFTLWIAGVVEEESCDGWAVGEMIKTGHIKPDYVVIGETTNLDIYRGHRGRCEIKVTVKGVSCHASAPERGANALYKMAKIISGIEQLNERLAYDEFLGKGTIVASYLESKTPSLNAVPDEAVLYIDRRLTVGESAESAMAEIKALPGAEEATVELLRYSDPSWTGYEKDVPKDYPTWVLPEEHLLVQAGAEAAAEVRGEQPAISRWVFSTDGIATMGQLGIPTIGFGPGEERWAHTVQDQVPINALVTAMAFYAAFPQILTKRVEGSR